MSFGEILLLGIGLAMDCLAVSLSKGIAAKKFFPFRAILMAVLFGLFQAGMPLIGYFAGNYFVNFISRIAPYLALVLLGIIGGKMIYEYFTQDDESAEGGKQADYSFSTLLVLSVATSIDALATGVLFVGQREVLWLAIGVIGLCSFFFSILGTYVGVSAGRRFNFPAELVGGLILVGIGLKIWIEGVIL